jgi:hypothetical protein
MRKIGFLGLLLAVVLASFLGTLWLTGEPVLTGSRSAAEQLASYSISHRSDLIEAAVASGLHASSNMKGNIDVMTRVNDREVTIQGWLADPVGDTASMAIIFVGGKHVASTRTQGERPDVTKALGLAFGAEKNVALTVTFECPAGARPFIVGLGSDNQYAAVSSPACP